MSMPINIAVIALTFLSIMMLACAPRSEPTQTPTAGPKGIAPTLSTKPAWEDDWERTVNAAKKEGEVMVYANYGPEWRQAMTAGMNKYGIAYNGLTARTDELMERVWRERQAKIYQADLLQAISVKAYYLESQRLGEIFQPLEKMLILPEVVDPKAWVGGELSWVDSDTKNLWRFGDYLAVPLIVNTDLVGPQEMKVWDDLLNPKWKGKMVLSDPTMSGTANTVMTQLAWRTKGWDFVDRLLQQEPIMSRDSRLMVEWVARGKYPIMIGPSGDTVYPFIQEGAPVKFVNFESVITSFGAASLAVLKDSPHPNAAKVFLNYFLSKEGQTLTAKTTGVPSSRVDVPTDFLEPSKLRLPGMKAFSSADKDYLQQLDGINSRIEKLVAPLKK